MNDHYLEMAHSDDVQSWQVNSYVIKNFYLCTIYYKCIKTLMVDIIRK